jgi:hypothetical protein
MAWVNELGTCSTLQHGREARQTPHEPRRETHAKPALQQEQRLAPPMKNILMDRLATSRIRQRGRQTLLEIGTPTVLKSAVVLNPVV